MKWNPNSNNERKDYIVHLRTKPGYTQYSGTVTVYAKNETDAIDRAFTKLQNGAHSDKGRGAWIIEKIEIGIN